MSDENKLQQALLDAEKEIVYLSRRYEVSQTELKLSERLRNNYKNYYLSSVRKLEKKQQELDSQNKKLELLNSRLEKIALFDGLTQLANRKSYETHLLEAVIDAEKEKSRFALLFLDLDGFKEVNDTYGHVIGDELLIATANRLMCIKPENAILARLGGDEFVLILNHIKTAKEAEDLAFEIVELCQKDIEVAGHLLMVSVSVGIAFYESDTAKNHEQTASYIQQCADLAMYKAKRTGKNRYCIYHHGMSEQARSETLLVLALRQAMKEGVFLPFYQPLYGGDGQAILSLEALVRWPKHDGGFIDLERFMPLLEKLNFMPQLDFLILEKVCEFLQQHSGLVHSIDYVAVNFSAKTFADSFCFERFQSILAKYNIAPNQIALELTEVSFLSESSRASDVMCQLRQLGVKLALDDFGTGYSALSYLNRIPVDVIKVDRYFVKSLPEDNCTKVIISHIIALAKELGLQVIVEGVENQQQLQLLKEQGCDVFQGYYFSSPLPESEIVNLLQRNVRFKQEHRPKGDVLMQQKIYP